jgi:hypothetical protein
MTLRKKVICVPRKFKTEKKELVRKVREYLERVKNGRDYGEKPKLYPLEERGMYKIFGGSYLTGGREQIQEIYTGRFIDVVAEAVQLGEFYGEWCGTDQPGNPSNGYVRKYEPEMIIEVPQQEGLIEMIDKIDELENEKKGLEEKLDKVNQELEV